MEILGTKRAVVEDSAHETEFELNPVAQAFLT